MKGDQLDSVGNFEVELREGEGYFKVNPSTRIWRASSMGISEASGKVMNAGYVLSLLPLSDLEEVKMTDHVERAKRIVGLAEEVDSHDDLTLTGIFTSTDKVTAYNGKLQGDAEFTLAGESIRLRQTVNTFDFGVTAQGGSLTGVMETAYGRIRQDVERLVESLED